MKKRVVALEAAIGDMKMSLNDLEKSREFLLSTINVKLSELKSEFVSCCEPEEETGMPISPLPLIHKTTNILRI